MCGLKRTCLTSQLCQKFGNEALQKHLLWMKKLKFQAHTQWAETRFQYRSYVWGLNPPYIFYFSCASPRLCWNLLYSSIKNGKIIFTVNGENCCALISLTSFFSSPLCMLLPHWTETTHSENMHANLNVLHETVIEKLAVGRRCVELVLLYRSAEDT